MNRRAVLRTSGAAVLSGLALSSSVSGKRTNKNRVDALFGSTQNPVQPEEILALQKRRDEEGRSKPNGTADKATRAYAVPEVSEKQQIVGYLHTVDEHGVEITHILRHSEEDDEADIESKHEEIIGLKDRIEGAESVRSAYERERNTQSDFTQSVTPAGDNPDVGLKWTARANVFDRDGNPANGDNVCQHDVTIYEFTGDIDIDDDLWAMQGIYRALPERHTADPSDQEYPYMYYTDEMSIRQNYDVALPDATLRSTDPSGSENGSVNSSYSITAGTGGADASITWEYTQPDVSRDDNSDTSSYVDTAAWDFDPNTDDTASSPLQIEPGSSVRFEKAEGCDDSPTSWNLGRSRLHCEFDTLWYGSTIEREVSDTFMVSVCP